LEVFFALDILKTSGEIEQFNIEKLRMSIEKAGATHGEAERVARNVEIRVRNSGKTDTEQIREWVIIELMSIPAYNAAEEYSSFKRKETAATVR
jgi:hypothetical protein